MAKRSRGTPRIANRLLRRVRDFAEVKHDGTISAEIAARALDMLNVDAEGFDYMDRKLLLAVLDKFFGGPVGLDNWRRQLAKSVRLSKMCWSRI